ncbi:GmrSD restriction endonuclease domain-containing protein [Lentisalinibacter salinarum]|uniref:GmrSD restriction endonuclease domain-containing protein n=1 Tax=Lentisalinibacter salinarum TaxID=2992239 RepID=UPI003865EEC8
MPHELEVTSTLVSGLLDKLRSREWQIPAFQRDFVWSIGDVSSLVQSILERRPIGMATLWQQPDETALNLEPISVPDNNVETGAQVAVMAGADSPPSRRYAVLDGRQRCTAIAMAFGGLRSTNNRFRFAGRFFLSISESDESKRVQFIKEPEVQRRHLHQDSVCVSLGLLPLASSNPEETLMQQFYRYTQAIANPENYPDNRLPAPEELARRNEVLARAFDGLMATKLAVYVVPASYTLAEICEIFEVLTTTGTRVSTVDLIHSWLFSDTSGDETPILLRDWIDGVGERDGAIGWASTSDRPELVAQMVTGCYVALEEKPEPRSVGRHQQSSITSVKAGDLLATPTEHWRQIISNEDLLVEYLGDFQTTVAGGYFPWKSCPYPVTASIYVGLRWHHRFDEDPTHPWSISDLNSLYRAFFWRNALSGRYDQGFLTQLGADVVKLKELLSTRRAYANFGDWASAVSDQLTVFMNKPLPDREELQELATGRQTGALQKAILLPILARARKDLLNPELIVAYPLRTDTQLHHIYPTNWCQNNRTGELQAYLDRNRSDRDWVNSAANLMPLSRESNLIWRSANPGAILRERSVDFDQMSEILESLFINREAFDALIAGADGLPDFWNFRAQLISHRLTQFTEVYA